MEEHIRLINDYWKDKFVLVNKDQPDFVAGKFKKISIYLDKDAYTIGPKLLVEFYPEHSDVDKQVFLYDTFTIDLDSRYNEEHV